MPIAGDNQDEQLETKIAEQVKIHDPQYKSSLVSASTNPPNSLMVHMDGFPWTVHYYSQVLGEDEEPDYYQGTQLPVYQQYIKITDLEIRVTDPLSQDQDTDSGEMTVTGSATLFPFLTPNVGDMFFAEVGDGRVGVFGVTARRRVSILAQTSYEIEYMLFQYVDTAVREEYDNRVVKHVFFKKDMLANGQWPMLVENEVKIKEEYESNIYYLLRRFMTEFYSREYSTLLVPGQQMSTYDHYLVKAVFRLFDPYDHPQLRGVRELNIDGERVMSSLNFWNVLMDMNAKYKDFVAQKMWVVPSEYFNRDPLLEGVRYSGIQRVVYPFEPPAPVDAAYSGYSEKSGINYDMLGDMDYQLVSVLKEMQPGGLDYPEGTTTENGGTVIEPEPNETPLIHPVLIDDYYVFSQSFYEESQTQSVLEMITHQVIRGDAVNFDYVGQLMEDIPSWGRLERFYYIPVLVTIMKVLLRRL